MGVGVIGAGSRATALAVSAGRAGHDVRLWSRNAEVADAINRERSNPCYLKETRIPDNVGASQKILDVVSAAELLIFAAPSHTARNLVSEMSAVLLPEMIFRHAAIGIERYTGIRI